MKSVIILALFVACSSAKSLNPKQSPISTYGYLTKYAVPLAESLKKAEEEILRNRASRITGGSEAEEGQFPYQAGIISDIRNVFGIGVCGGSLIKADRVLTAAHCWWDGRNQAWRFTVVLGSNLLFSGGERIITTDVVTHPLWIPQLTFNDIAMVRLPEPVELSAKIATVSLPQGFDIFEDFHLHTAIASGYGVKKDGGNITETQNLSHVSMTVISNEVCDIAYLGNIHYSNLCTNTLGGSSTCKGDTGGPLVVMRNGNPMLIGVSSYTVALGCELGWPAVFSRITSFLNFINTN
ncbi:unnamed protein product [Danaus chrysippus]|uniref:(African queen) hypothetical protein n=1 Tax=Danaus chrysippus TaxID=151541 RepID=A0A8J2QVB6_9NEOP|nr:unnamed protein product [Danaus chrysippus]